MVARNRFSSEKIGVISEEEALALAAKGGISRDLQISSDPVLTPDGGTSALDSGTSEADLQDDAISRLHTEFGDPSTDAKVQIWRVIPNSRQPVYIYDLLPSECSLERIADDCGGGVYTLRVYVPRVDDEGIRRGVKLALNPQIRIDGAPKEFKRVEKIRPMDERPASVNDALIQAMSAGFTKLGELIVASRPKEKSTLEIAQELNAIKTLFAPVNPAPPIDPLDILQKTMTIVNDMPKPGDSGDMGAITELLRTFRVMLPQIQNPAIAAPVDSPLVTPDPVQPIQPAKDENVISFRDLDPLRKIYTGYVELLVSQARANNDVQQTAAAIYEQAPDALLDWIFESEDYLTKLAEYCPDVKLYPIWFKQLRDALKKLDAENDSGKIDSTV